MRKRSKRYRELAEKYDLETAKSIDEAAKILKESATAKFDESIDLALRLNIDTRKADQQVRGSFSMPNGTGRDVRVIVFVDDSDKAKAALEAGADKAGGEELVNEVQGGFMDFDVAIATPKMMRLVGRLGRVLGPRGLMPAPKAGTVNEDVATAVAEFKAGKVEYRADGAGNVHVRVGAASFEAEKLAENLKAITKHIIDGRPAAVKGDFVTSAAVSSTMGPGIRLAI